MIRSGRADMVVVGGTEACIHPLPLAAFAAMRALSERNDDPAAASRPWDTGRDGFVFGEGAAVLVLETGRARGSPRRPDLRRGRRRRHHRRRSPHRAARTRGTRRRARHGGWPLPTRKLSPSDVVHINAHGTSTPQGDIAEALAIAAALGDDAARTLP